MSASIWWNGRVVPFALAKVHVTSETAMRGVNAFEGVRAYWRHDQRCWAVVSLADHLSRLESSLRLLVLPASEMVPPLAVAVADLIQRQPPGHDLYLRPTIYLDEGSYTGEPEQCTFGAFVVARPAPSDVGPVSVCVSSLRRVPARAFPARAKSGAAYAMFRLARLEANSVGYDEAIMLDGQGHVTETGGASIFVVSAGQVVTPSLDDDILDSITRRHALAIMRSRLGTAVAERSVAGVELLAADEAFLAGTLDEIRTVSRLRGGRPALAAAIGTAVRDSYLAMCRGRAEPLSESMFTMVRP